MKRQMVFSVMTAILLLTMFWALDLDSSVKGEVILETEPVLTSIPVSKPVRSKPDEFEFGWCRMVSEGMWCNWDPTGGNPPGNCSWTGHSESYGCGYDSSTFECCNLLLI